jgi:phosphoglycolate phosphatase
MKQTYDIVQTLPWRLHQFDAALVDLDGTLVDTLDDFVEGLQRMLRDLPAPYCTQVVQRRVVEHMVGKGSENLVNSLLDAIDKAQGAAASPALRVQALNTYLRHYREVNGLYARVFDGAREGLDAFRADGWKLACVTNKPTDYARALLRLQKLDSYFTAVLGGDATPRKKPDPMPLLAACAAMGARPERTLMVGDSSNDAQAARAAGCPVLLVTYGYNHGEPILQVDADAFTESLAHLRWHPA